MQQYAKLKRDEFSKAVREELITIEEFAETININQSYLSRIDSESRSGCRCTVKFVRRVLKGFDGKYTFDDLFFWA